MQQEPIKVVLRMRPSSKQTNHFVKQNNSISIIDQKKYSQMNKNYYFDNVYNQQSSTHEIYNTTIKSLIQQSFTQQVNSTIFTYGCTGSGKTFTMFGDNSSQNIQNREGILTRCLREIVQKKFQFGDIDITCSCIQIYNQQVHDLLANQQQQNNYLAVHQDQQKKQFNVAGVKTMYIKNIEEAIEVINIGQKNRRFAQTVRNRMSSRSHIVFRVNLKNQYNQKIYINFVDLAGSEKLIKQRNLERINQSKNINKSLFFLTQVVYTLTKQSQDPFIPYRNSTLTKILKSSLGGSSRTCMILCIDPSQYENSLSTIRFGYQAKQIKNKIQSSKNSNINENIQRQQYFEIKKELEYYKNRFEQTDKIYQSRVDFYEKQIQNLTLKLIEKDRIICSLSSISNKVLAKPLSNFLQISQNIHPQQKIEVLQKKINKQIKKIESMKSIIHEQNYVHEKLSKIILLYHNNSNLDLQKLNSNKLKTIKNNIEILKQKIQKIQKNNNQNFQQDNIYKTYYNNSLNSLDQILKYYPEQFYNIPFLVNLRPEIR